ncbi:TetR/AcrR family transcriptional regulator [Agromyces sp. MMS24-JH15]|uniref:TetR/AcrR family transcriptional regulator n=1 Tax=Agromyces sp. MMS24-JH15 TaxID=3243765 RepID=UPI0037497997
MGTTHSLIRVARRLTAERGLAGFTIEELCSEAAVSRRTFFNYFASKDDAVLGIPLDRADAAAVARFLAEAPDAAAGLSPTLLTDLAVLTIERWHSMDDVAGSAADLFAAVDREPRLLARMLEHGVQEEQFDARLIEQREHLPEGDLRAQAAAQIIGAIARASALEFLSTENADTFVHIFERRIAAARDVFSTQATR